MKIKRSINKPRLANTARKFSKKRVFFICFTLCYTLMTFGFGYFVHKKSMYDEKMLLLIKVIKNNILLIPNVIQGFQSNPISFSIDIKHKHFQKLAYQRDMALAKTKLVTDSKSYVPATIRYNEKSVKVKIRLKGDRIDHLIGDKWSYRIKVQGDNTILGMKQFSLHHPKTRNYIFEWIYHQTLKKEGVLALRYEFINIVLNGKDLGVYALEEHFEKRLIENNQNREGPIIRFTENIFWDEVIQQTNVFPNAMTNGSGAYLSSDIDAFQTNKLLSDSTSHSQFMKAVNILEAFRRGNITTSRAFDVQKLARYFAITDLMGAEHGSRWHNIRFYYNPITSKLEPIGFDGNSGKPLEALWATKRKLYIGKIPPNRFQDYYSMIFADPIFFKAYVRNLERVSEPQYLMQLITELREGIEKKLTNLYKEFPYYKFSIEVLQQNQKYIMSVLNPVKGLHAYYKKTENNLLMLNMGNIQSMPLEILYISYKDSVFFEPVHMTLLPANNRTIPVEYQNVDFIIPQGFDWSDTKIQDIRVKYKILGASNKRSESIFPWSYSISDFIEGDFIRQESNVQKFKFLRVDEDRKEILIKPGVWNLDQNLIIPQGYKLICNEGTKIILSNSSKILSYSPLEFIGSDEYPIYIQSIDSTGQGLVVINANDLSFLHYVKFINLSPPSQEGWDLLGAVTFYESPVEFSYCQFSNNRSEDALNIVRSEFTISNSHFNQSLSDAFDADFSKGEITNSTFIDCGNDAIDGSGSEIEIQNIFIKGVGDKGVSAGENSKISVALIEIINAEIAIASKDNSIIEIIGIKMVNCKIGFTLFQKKAEFDAASVTVTNLEKSQITIPYMVEDNSTFILDGKLIAPNQRNVKEIIYTNK